MVVVVCVCVCVCVCVVWSSGVVVGCCCLCMYVAWGGCHHPPLPTSPTPISHTPTSPSLTSPSHHPPPAHHPHPAQAAVAKSGPRARLNAFELLNSALDISAIFEVKDDVVTRRTRFTSKAPTHDLLAALQGATKNKGGTVHVQGNDTSRCVVVFVWCFRGYMVCVDVGVCGVLFATHPPPTHRLRIRLLDRNNRPLVVDVDVGDVAAGIKLVEVAKYSGNSVEFYTFYRYLLKSVDTLILKRDPQVGLGGGGGMCVYV